MFSDAVSGSSTESKEDERWEVFAFGFPPLWSELVRFFIIFRVVVVSNWLESEYRPLFDWDSIQVVIFCDLPQENTIPRPIKPRCFVFNPINVD